MLKKLLRIFRRPEERGLEYFSRHLLIVVGMVLVWRGIWHVLDHLDVVLFAGNHFWTGLAGIALGLLLLYLPDRDLKELAQH